MRARLLATSVAVLLALTLAGCSDDPQPIIEPAPSTTAAPSPEPTPSSTPTPEPETESAKEFIRRFQQEATNAQATGETSSYRNLTAQCEGCNTFADLVDDFNAKGRSIAPGDTSVRDVQRVGGNRGVVIMEYDVVSDPTIVRASSGKKVMEFPGGIERFQLNLIRRSQNWTVVRLVQVTRA
jgi:hypothetical protein